MIYFSATTMGFYLESMKNDGSYGDHWPKDAIQLTAPETNIFWNKSPPGGKKLGSENKRPVWIDMPSPTYEELIFSTYTKKNQLKAAADSEIDWLQDAVDAEKANEKEISALAAWRKYRIALMRIDISHMPIIWPTTPEE
ncbi:tail fiber assembly protein [Yersinia pseudotuberculosis]|uniref:tail fiber assembly protein n=1 Tax=Yersinia pseudotuberculosis TaxID=633 RepID=UPI0005DC3574|nr:tail assembly chaperone [Yersinia pseudotuberculosis]CNB84753.1 tail fiber assembly protein p37 [Yersinia pseudotuberculosis]